MAVVTDEFEKFLYSLFLRDVLFHTLLGLVETDLSTACTYITVISISHLARTVDDTSHDTYLQSHEVLRCRLNLGDGFLEVIERTSATRTGDVFGLGKLNTGGLEDSVGEN